MVRRILGFFKAGPDSPPISDDPKVIEKLFERKRMSVFLSVTFGYGFFYVARINFSVAKRPLLDAGIFDNTEMGIIGSALLGVYAIGKLLNGILSDRANIARFMSTALLLSAAVNLVLGSTTMFWAFVLLWGLNGLFQSVGSAPSVVSLSQWFSRREIGTRYGVWSASHGLGTAVTFIFTSVVVATFGWRWAFWGPGAVCFVVALIMYKTMADRPETYGLPNVSVYKNDVSGEQAVGDTRTVGQQQLEVLRNPAIWILGVASAMMYVARYGINNWGQLFLQQTKGYTLIDSGSIMGAYTLATVAGAVSSGWISDRFFNSSRNVPALLMGIFNIASLTVLFLAPPDNLWIDVAALVVFGFVLGGLLAYLGGLMAVDLSSKRAAGTAMGMIGGFSYVGAAVQDTITGVLLDGSKVVAEVDMAGRFPSAADSWEWMRSGAGYVERLGVCSHDVYSYDSAFHFWIGAAVVSLLLTLTVWNAKPRS